MTASSDDQIRLGRGFVRACRRGVSVTASSDDRVRLGGGFARDRELTGRQQSMLSVGLQATLIRLIRWIFSGETSSNQKAMILVSSLTERYLFFVFVKTS